jgi:hypothetical protein
MGQSACLSFRLLHPDRSSHNPGTKHDIERVHPNPGSDNLGMDRDEFRKVCPEMFNPVTHNFSQ